MNKLLDKLEQFGVRFIKDLAEYNKFLREENKKIAAKIDESIKLMECKDKIKG